MLSAAGTYRDWRAIDYRPALASHAPDALIAELPPHATVLEIGCNEGIVSCELAGRRPDVTVRGVDINGAAIEAARRRAADTALSNVAFAVDDALHAAGSYDAVMAIRVLTCFPGAAEWEALVRAIVRLLRPNGLFYAIDYQLDETNPAYAARYAAGARAGWRRGTFRVSAASGEPLFVAHHHTEEEIACLSRMFTNVRIRRFQSLSMNGNPAAMFEFLGTRGEVAR
ncbi:MAG TPA: class I SAM-dependent methyltransferase [Thermoanaerobaculia bacterium]|nr:class I SAM-dependent methyltransferase [Thermoanaerobaculia bacterium]